MEWCFLIILGGRRTSSLTSHLMTSLRQMQFDQKTTTCFFCQSNFPYQSCHSRARAIYVPASTRRSGRHLDYFWPFQMKLNVLTEYLMTNKGKQSQTLHRILSIKDTDILSSLFVCVRLVERASRRLVDSFRRQRCAMQGQDGWHLLKGENRQRNGGAVTEKPGYTLHIRGQYCNGPRCPCDGTLVARVSENNSKSIWSFGAERVNARVNLNSTYWLVPFHIHEVLDSFWSWCTERTYPEILKRLKYIFNGTNRPFLLLITD